jgi:hypothetical protein
MLLHCFLFTITVLPIPGTASTKFRALKGASVGLHKLLRTSQRQYSVRLSCETSLRHSRTKHIVARGGFRSYSKVATGLPTEGRLSVACSQWSPACRHPILHSA